ncbi:MAG: CRISPR-associated endonuclease Cas1 [Deltaproteobacteria bacterium]|nr:CRISPR-associated endonuclease Cas1 [Deltaproteobacteria bacterium]
MKTNFPLLARIAAPQNLSAAWLRVSAKGSAGGYDAQDVEGFARDVDRSLKSLHEELVSQKYVPEPLLNIDVKKHPSGSETRTLGLPSVRDKVAQHAALAVLEPILEKDFVDFSYGYRRGKGAQKAIGRARHYIANRKCVWTALGDIDDFFGSLDHGLLLRRLGEAAGDDAVLRLVELWMKMGAVDRRGRWHDVESGVAQGSVVSPLLANFYLHPLDRFLAEAGTDLGAEPGAIRYADNLILFARKRSVLEKAFEKAVGVLRDPLCLHLNDCLQPVVAVEQGFSFLGIRFWGNELGIAEEKLEKIRARVDSLCPKVPAGPFEGALRSVNEAVAGWQRYYGALVPAAEFRKIEDAVVAGVQRLTAAALERGLLAGSAQAKEALERLQLPSARDPKARRQLVLRIVEGARQNLRTKATPEGRQAGPSVSAAVRKKKALHARRQTATSELVLHTPGLFLGKSGGRLVVRQSRRIVTEVPAVNVSAVTIGSHGISFSADVVTHCAEKDIPLFFVEYPGRLRALLAAPHSSSVELQALQLQASLDPKSCCRVARQFVHGKLKNQRNLALYLGKYHKKATRGFQELLDGFLQEAEGLLQELSSITGDGGDDFRGKLFSVEGRFASTYWSVYGSLLAAKVDFPGRRHEGATDLVNSLLNYGYAILESRVYLALLKAGLNPQIGFLHTVQRKRSSLVYDLMEEFRPQVVDRTVSSLISRREPLELDADRRLTMETRKRLISQIYERLATIVEFHGREQKLEEIIPFQARALARHLRGEANYKPYVGKW